jgi:hypothetical protein
VREQIPAPNEPLLKAAGFNSLIRVVRHKVSEPAFDRFAMCLPNATRELIGRPPLAISWIPLETSAPVYEVLHEQLFARDDSMMFELGRRQLRADMTGIYRLLMRVTTPEFVATQAAKIYGNYTRNCGTLRAASGDLHRLEIMMEDRPFSSRAFCDYMRGSIFGVMELTGVNDLAVSMTALPGFPARCRFGATWA